MKNRLFTLLPLAILAVSGCHSAPSRERVSTAAEPVSVPPETAPIPVPANPDSSTPAAEAPKTESSEIQACTCANNVPKPIVRRRPKPVAPPAAPAPPAAAPPSAPAEAAVKLVEKSSASILGKKVRAEDGDDLGRIVDILADGQGRVRMAIIEFGGFLGVGNRRIAVDWSLLRFQLGDAEAPVIVNTSKRKLQGTPEWKGAERPLALMGPAAPLVPPK